MKESTTCNCKNIDSEVTVDYLRRDLRSAEEEVAKERNAKRVLVDLLTEEHLMSHSQECTNRSIIEQNRKYVNCISEIRKVLGDSKLYKTKELLVKNIDAIINRYY